VTPLSIVNFTLAYTLSGVRVWIGLAGSEHEVENARKLTAKATLLYGGRRTQTSIVVDDDWDLCGCAVASSFRDIECGRGLWQNRAGSVAGAASVSAAAKPIPAISSAHSSGFTLR